MLSSIYHHVSIIRLDVHPLYIEYLHHGTDASLDRTNTSWSCPTIRRTRWYDLLSGEDRGELFRGLWGIFSYQMRTGQQSVHAPDRQNSDTTITQHYVSAVSFCGILKLLRSSSSHLIHSVGNSSIDTLGQECNC